MPTTTLNRAEVRRLLGEFDFSALFAEELGWNRVPEQPLAVARTSCTIRVMWAFAPHIAACYRFAAAGTV